MHWEKQSEKERSRRLQCAEEGSSQVIDFETADDGNGRLRIRLRLLMKGRSSKCELVHATAALNVDVSHYSRQRQCGFFKSRK